MRYVLAFAAGWLVADAMTFGPISMWVAERLMALAPEDNTV